MERLVKRTSEYEILKAKNLERFICAKVSFQELSSYLAYLNSNSNYIEPEIKRSSVNYRTSSITKRILE